MILVVVPRTNGHFQNYIDILKDSDQYLETLVVSEGSLVSFVKDLVYLLRCRDVTQYMFLHGEQQLIYATLLGLLTKRRVKCLVYYALHKPNTVVKSIQLAFLKCAHFLGVEVLGLDYASQPTAGISWVKSVPDPVLLRNVKSLSSHFNLSLERWDPGSISFLLAGYIDSRKCPVEIIEALSAVADKIVNQSFKINLKIVGSICPMIESSLYSLQDMHRNVYIEIRAERVTDAELSKLVSNTDVVFCLYREHYGSSGMFINAIACDKAVLFQPIGVLGGFSGLLRIEAMPADLSKASIVNSIEVLINNYRADKGYRQYSDGDRRNFLSSRTRARFLECLVL